MDELYDCHHSGVGFVVSGRCFTYSSTFSNAPPKIPTASVSINIMPYIGFGKSSGSFSIGRVMGLHGSYVVCSPRFSFHAAAPPKLEQYIRNSITETKVALPSGDLGSVELAIGRAACDYNHPTQLLATCDLESRFDKQGLFLRFTGLLDPSDRTDSSLIDECYCAEAAIEWRVLRFLFDINFVKVMYDAAMKQ